ncbi:MAG TPA: 3-hydroxyacyl-CoA dehydrogenase, partial [Rhodanobacteraceae bacterium]|nr:3-hydroxyacyl-CoA dehydrogenase [Rhodanobacteraceae bacterium]
MFEGLRFSHWQASIEPDGLVVLAMDRAGSKVNALSRNLLDELDAIVERIAIERPRGVVIHSAKAAGFAV